MRNGILSPAWFKLTGRLFTIFALAGLSIWIPFSDATAGFWFWDDDEPEVRSSVRVTKNMSNFDALGLAKITLGDAVAIAVAEVKGRALGGGLVEDDGYLFYRVAVVSPDREVFEVSVDPVTGEVLLAEADDDDDDDDDDDEDGDDDDDDDEDER